jgi:hypothetical protein
MTGRCPLCGESVAPGDDVVQVHGGEVMHQSCLAECDGEVERMRLECSTAEIERMRRQQRAQRNGRKDGA